jgi:hypothetical protein
MAKARTKASKAAKRPDEERVAQIQVYAPPDLVEWLDLDRAACQGEIQAEMGQQQQLSRSAHVVVILHQYRLSKDLSDAAGGPPGCRGFWTQVREVQRAAQAKREKVKQ